MESKLLDAVKYEMERGVTGIKYTAKFGNVRINSRTVREQDKRCEVYTEQYKDGEKGNMDHVFVNTETNTYYDYSDTIGEYQWVKQNFPEEATIGHIAEHTNFCELLVRMYEEGMEEKAEGEYMYESTIVSNGVITTLRELFEDDDGSFIKDIEKMTGRVKIDGVNTGLEKGVIQLKTEAYTLKLSFEFLRPDSVQIPNDVKQQATDLEELSKSML